MRLAATVILYYPDQNIVNNIKSYLDVVDILLIYDNSNLSQFEKFNFRDERIKYFWDGENKGIAVRLNQALQLCKTNRFDLLLTMDQDSFFDKNIIEQYILKIKNHENKNNIGIFGINPSQHESNDLINSFFITSGSFVNVNIADKIGGFDENLFIDDVDTDFCLNLIKKGYNTYKFGNIFLNHNLGTKKYVYTFLLNKKIRIIYKPLRIYYATRNFLYINKKYKKSNTRKNERVKELIWRIKNSIIYGNPIKTLYFVLKGIIDFKTDKMGKINQFIYKNKL